MLAPLIVSMPERSFPLATVLSCSLWAFVTLPKDLFQLDLHISTVPLLSPFGFVPGPSPLNVHLNPWLSMSMSLSNLPSPPPVLPLDAIQDHGSRGWAHRFDTGMRARACVWVNSSWVSKELQCTHTHTRSCHVCESEAGALPADLLENELIKPCPHLVAC